MHSSSLLLNSRFKFFFLATFFVGLLVPLFARAQQIVHVPSEQPNLQAAISSVPNGGIIEMAGGTYKAPSGGYTLYDLPFPKSFTVRAAVAAAVTFTGGGTTDILRFAPSNLSKAGPVTFENLTFANGLSQTGFIGGALTLVNAQAIFKSCTFQNNAANSPGPGTGGGAQWIAGSVISFDSCTWTNNTSPNFGAGMSVTGSRVYITNSRFASNRVNLPNHSPNAAGGAIFVNDATLRVSNCSFDSNQAGYVGGAIYAIGSSKDPVSTPTVDLIVQDSVFNGNLAQFDPAFNPPPAPAVGGAMHFEGQTTAKINNCRFNNNTARQGGALSNYLAITEITGCVFRGNTATGAGRDEGLGGAIIALSSETALPNHRPMQLIITDTLIQGPGTSVPSARQGGCIFAGGDLNFAYGLGGLMPDGDAASNRGVVKLTRVAMSDAAAIGDASLPGTGGAFLGAFVDLTMDNSIVENCRTSNSGGAIQLIQGSVAKITNSIISHCIPGEQGVITAYGSNLDMSGSSIVDNNGSGLGVGITSAPSPPAFGLPAFDINGLIQNCVFSKNVGGSIIYDGDRLNQDGPPFNRLQFSQNQFFPADNNVYFNDIIGARSVAQLNSLVIPRSDNTQSVKSPSANVASTSAPLVGSILMTPRTILAAGAPDEAVPIPAYLTYAASGAKPSLDGTVQAAEAAVVATQSAGPHTLTVGGRVFTTPPPPGPTIIGSSSATGRTGRPFKFQVISTGATSAARLSASGLPPGLTVDAVTGVISGIPTNDGSFVVTLTLTDRNLTTTSTLRFTFVSDPAFPVIVSSSSATLVLGQPFTYTIIAPGSSDPTDPTTFDLLGTLPVGLTFDSKTGTISGTYIGNPLRDGGPPDRKDLSGGVITNVQLFAMNSHGTATVPLNFFLAPAGTVNISTRIAIGTGENVLIGGFIITGNAPKKVIIRSIGPSLKANGAPVPGTLQDPILELHEGGGALLGMNDDWRTNQEKEIIDTTVAPADDRESAIVATLSPGNYTAIVGGKKANTGIGLVEVYDLGTASLDTTGKAQLAQISTRGTVQSADNVMIGGFIISGTTTKVIVRAIGPELTTVAGALQDTTLELRDGSGSLIMSNDDWRSDHEQQIIDTTVPPNDDRESAIVASLIPGSYTAIVRGKGNTTGVALVEVYALQ